MWRKCVTLRKIFRVSFGFDWGFVARREGNRPRDPLLGPNGTGQVASDVACFVDSLVEMRGTGPRGNRHSCSFVQGAVDTGSRLPYPFAPLSKKLERERSRCPWVIGTILRRFW
ncbi:hypothetical protein Pan216_08740 [Planctomycetes bacterium Pan216]|uniref:Uncharacterized protein n=1 Tax=Kolteria novifilia TaxID=2527975 RepID=A0A518AZ74_9BACT|nr:hypothetical protein Pan216_08740 [Planctomycetes bacterium Pan216]